jgi:hypothetical protein
MERAGWLKVPLDRKRSRARSGRFSEPPENTKRGGIAPELEPAKRFRREQAALHLSAHALAPVAELPVLEIVSATQILADLTLDLGKVVYDYLPQPNRLTPRINEMALTS